MIGILGDENYGVTFVILFITHLVDDNLKYKGYFLHENLQENYYCSLKTLLLESLIWEFKPILATQMKGIWQPHQTQLYY